MNRNTGTRRYIVLASILFVAALMAAPSLASAQMREFSGRIDKISKGKMIVDNRQGDKVSFVPIETTEVEGQEKTSWDDLKKGDWVTVSWKFVDKPRKAYKIIVLPPKEDD